MEGLRSAALRNPLRTTVVAAGLRRYPLEVESAAYFCCLEALQNAAKHAIGATVVVVDLSDNGSLRLDVRDDGGGFDPGAVAAGSGFVNMRDRLAAVGGELEITSSPGHGTRVKARHPAGLSDSEAHLGDELAGRDRAHERGVVALVLVGVVLGERRERTVEGVAGPEVGRDRDGVAGAGVRAGQRPAADLGVGTSARWAPSASTSAEPLPSHSWRM